MYRWNGFSLVDSPDGSAAVIYCKGCILTCKYCHNPELRSFTSQEEDLNLFQIKDKIKNLVHETYKEVDWIIISGGEPLCSDIEELKEVFDLARELKFKIGVYTSGLYPEKIREIIDYSWYIDYWHVDYKYYEVLENKIDIDNKTLSSLKILFKSTLINNKKIEINTTIMKSIHDIDTLKHMKNRLLNIFDIFDDMLPMYLNKKRLNYLERTEPLIRWTLTPVRIDNNIQTLTKLDFIKDGWTEKELASLNYNFS